MKTFTETHKALLRRRTATLAGWLADLPERDWKNPKPYDDAVAVLIRRLECLPEGPATTRTRWDGSSVHMLDLRASSTSSITGALYNWIVQARAKAGDA